MAVSDVMSITVVIVTVTVIDKTLWMFPFSYPWLKSKGTKIQFRANPVITAACQWLRLPRDH